MSILLRPLITEKSKKDAEAGKFTFEVVASANKNQITHVVENAFGVKVKGVKTVKISGKTRRFGGRRLVKKLSDIKKAIVELEKGQTIDLFATEKKGGKRKV
ncbi:50S ribosomal protein L23 [Candidatus Microgenomates bacterium]|nr:50S ribosomal protein L23 [Candidatus Microgenomates bacterium]